MIDNTLNCWNYRNPFTQDNIHEVVKDDTNLQFASGLKVTVKISYAYTYSYTCICLSKTK